MEKTEKSLDPEKNLAIIEGKPTKPTKLKGEKTVIKINDIINQAINKIDFSKIDKLIEEGNGTWSCFTNRDLLLNGSIEAYISSGMSIWPCGKTFQEGGRDGFDKDEGTSFCMCDFCESLRREIKELNKQLKESKSNCIYEALITLDRDSLLINKDFFKAYLENQLAIKRHNKTHNQLINSLNDPNDEIIEYSLMSLEYIECDIQEIWRLLTWKNSPKRNNKAKEIIKDICIGNI